MHRLTRFVRNYVEERVKNGTLIWPRTTEDAILFAQTEIAEAVEVLFARKEYVRNNPDNKPTWSSEAFARELGDAIFMLIVAGIMVSCDPIGGMLRNFRDKRRELEDARTDKE